MATTLAPSSPPQSANVQGNSNNGLLSTLSNIAVNAASTAGKVATKAGGKGLHAVNIAGGISKNAVLTTADAVGLKDKVEAAEKMARKVAIKGFNDTSKAVNKARRLANKALIFDEEDGSELHSSDYDLLLSAAGATEITIPPHSSSSQTFAVPANCAMVWKARVKHFDVGFALHEISEHSSPNNSAYHHPNQSPQSTTSESTAQMIIQVMQRYSSEAQIQGTLPPTDRARNVNLFFDNTYSHLQRKTVVFWVAVGEKVSLADDQVGAARSKEVAAANEGPPLFP